MFAVQRTWQVFAGDCFLGYEYAQEEHQVLAKTIIKFGAPERWSINKYTIEKIKWNEEDI